MTTFPICPSDRLQRRLITVLDDELLPLSAFTGFTLCDDRENDEVKLPFIVVRVTESDEIPQAGTVWHCRLNVNMVEDRQEANLILGGDNRPRHELRAENISALLFGVWNTTTLGQKINAISNGQGVYVLKQHSNNMTPGSSENDTLSTEYAFTIICASTQQ